MLISIVAIANLIVISLLYSIQKNKFIKNQKVAKIFAFLLCLASFGVYIFLSIYVGLLGERN